MGSLVNVIVDTIVLFRDHFIIKRHLTLTEGILFLLVFVRSIWFTLFGVKLGTSSVEHEAWIWAFWFLVVIHITSFWLKDIKWRAGVASLYAFVWGAITILVGLTSFSSPATPTFGLFSLASLFLAIRMFREGEEAGN